MRIQQEKSHSWWRFGRQGNSALLPWHQPIGDLWTLWTVPSAPDWSNDWSYVCASFICCPLPPFTPVSYLCGLDLSWAWQSSGQQVKGQQVWVGNSHVEHTTLHTHDWGLHGSRPRRESGPGRDGSLFPFTQLFSLHAFYWLAEKNIYFSRILKYLIILLLLYIWVLYFLHVLNRFNSFNNSNIYICVK